MQSSGAARDDAVLSIAKAIVKTGYKIIFGPASALADPFTDIFAQQLGSLLDQRRTKRMVDACVDIIADRILKSLGQEYKDLSDNEYIAACLAVADTFKKSEIDIATIVRLDLNANLLRTKVQPASRGVLEDALLSEPATELYRRVLQGSCAYLTQFVATMPQFKTDALAELLRRETQVLGDLQSILRRMPQSRGLDDFDADYRQVVMNKLNRMELFGLSLDQVSPSYPLSVAYVSLQVLRNQEMRGRTPINVPVSVGTRVEDALATFDRILVIGEAGSGKTTLLRYVAVTNAERGFTRNLISWNDRVAFYIPLRRYVDAELPAPGEFPKPVAANIIEEMPNGWVNRLLREGKAIVLVDGLDEMPEGPIRDRAQTWLSNLVADYPNARYVVTSRPTVISDTWPDKNFAIVELQPMAPEDVATFIESWHKAMRREIGEGEETESLDSDQRAMLSAIDTDRNLKRLAVNPLLCALLCALNRDRNRQLPKERMEIYAAALEMLLGRRDRERGIKENLVDSSSQRVILSDLAFWMFRQSLATAPFGRVQGRIERTMTSLMKNYGSASQVLSFLMSRSGLLREPSVGQIDFIHRTFQEYLAAEAAVDNDEIELLIDKAGNDQWREIIIMAVGHAKSRQRTALLRGLLKSAGKESSKRLSLLTVACLQTAPKLDADLRQEIENMARTLVPPKTLGEAESLAPAGSLVLDVLAARPPRNPEEAAASVRLAAMIGGEEGLNSIAEIAGSTSGIERELVRALIDFDPDQYAARVFTRAKFGPGLEISGTNLLPHIEFMTSLESMKLHSGDMQDLTRLGTKPPKLTQFSVSRRPRTSIRGLERWNGLTHIEIVMVNTVADLSPLRSITSLECLRLVVQQGIAVQLSLVSLQQLAKLRHLQLDIDTHVTIDILPLSMHKDLVIFASRSIQLAGVDKLDPTSKAVNVDMFPPLY